MIRKSLAVGIVFLFVFSSVESISIESQNGTKEIENPDIKQVISPTDSPWPMFGHDNRHTGRSPYSTIDNPGFEKWRFKTESWILGSPVIDENGIIYIGSCGHYLHSIYPNGTMQWKFYIGQRWIEYSPAIAEDGTIYVGTSFAAAGDNVFYAINPDGTEKWRYNNGEEVRSSPVIGEDGTIYFGSWEGNIKALYSNGTLKWSYPTDWFVSNSPAIGSDGTIYCGSYDGNMYALFPNNGTLKWKYPTDDWIRGSPSISDEGIIFFSSYDDHLYSLYPNGTLNWRKNTETGTSSTPAIGTDGTIYIGTEKLYAFHPNGILKWSFYFDDYGYLAKSTPAISADGTIYVGVNHEYSSYGEIIAIDYEGYEKWRVELPVIVWFSSSPAIGKDGTIYIGSNDDILVDPPRVDDVGYLHAFRILDPNAPEEPSVIGETDGKAGVEYEYTFSSSDPNGDDIYYHIDWGDNQDEESIGPYELGEEVVVCHIWEERGTYIIKARANDTNNLLSPWGELEVAMPVNQQSYSFPLLQRLLEQFPNGFPILRFLLTK